jgi:hypothetical protein
MAAGIAAMSSKARCATASRPAESYVPVMRRTFRVLIATVLLVCVLAVVVSPFVDLPASTLRARTAALVCFFALAAIAYSVSGFIALCFSTMVMSRGPSLMAAAGAHLTCVRLC